MKKNIMVMCTGNSFRSQIAEGYLRKFAGEKANVYSAGVKATGKVTDKAIRLMAEDGLDISNHTSNQIDEYLDIQFDYLITVCDHAKETCPLFPKSVGEKLHQSFPDPEIVEGQSDEEYFNSLRPIREMIKEYCQKFVAEKL